jgi:hypothetical protein
VGLGDEFGGGRGGLESDASVQFVRETIIPFDFRSRHLGGHLLSAFFGRGKDKHWHVPKSGGHRVCGGGGMYATGSRFVHVAGSSRDLCGDSIHIGGEGRKYLKLARHLFGLGGEYSVLLGERLVMGGDSTHAFVCHLR